MKKFTIVALSLVVALASTSAQSQIPFIRTLGNGADPCAKWDINDAFQSQMGAWALGYVTGAIRYAQGGSLNLARTVVFSWITRYCSDHPSAYLSDAADDFVRALAELGWPSDSFPVMTPGGPKNLE
jgi:hypothetical protein